MSLNKNESKSDQIISTLSTATAIAGLVAATSGAVKQDVKDTIDSTRHPQVEKVNAQPAVREHYSERDISRFYGIFNALCDLTRKLGNPTMRVNAKGQEVHTCSSQGKIENSAFSIQYQYILDPNNKVPFRGFGGTTEMMPAQVGPIVVTIQESNGKKIIITSENKNISAWTGNNPNRNNPPNAYLVVRDPYNEPDRWTPGNMLAPTNYGQGMIILEQIMNKYAGSLSKRIEEQDRLQRERQNSQDEQRRKDLEDMLE